MNAPGSRLEYTEETQHGRLFPDENLKEILQRYGHVHDFLALLASRRRGIAVTFSSQAAFDDPTIEFINVLHPLTQAIKARLLKQGAFSTTTCQGPPIISSM